MSTAAKTKRPRAQFAPGFRVGMLQITGKTAQRKNGYTVWSCRCDCGSTVELDTRTLQRGAVRDCGCVTKAPTKAIDLTGRRFGRLVALSVTDQREYASVVWRCRCDCGAETCVSARMLQNGNTKSCGCLIHLPREDYVGKRFGRLTVLGYEGRQNGQHRWRCRCDCGSETVVSQAMLHSGRTQSCGCRKAEAARDAMKLVDHTSVARLEAGKKRLLRSNKSGCSGVYQNRKTGRWRAQISFRGKTYYLGSYLTLEQAVEARKKGEKLHDDFLQQYYAEHKSEP